MIRGFPGGNSATVADPIRHRHRAELAEGLHVIFTAPEIRPVDPLVLMCEWDPAIPARITRAMREQYREARCTFIRQVTAASDLASSALILET